MLRRKSQLLVSAMCVALGAFTVTWTVSLPGAGGTEDRFDSSDPAAEKVLRELEGRLTKAVLQGELGTFEELLADDFTHTSQDGRFRTKAEWMKGRVQGKTNYVSYEMDDLQIRVYGDAGVVTGVTNASWRESDGTMARGRYRLLRVWARRDGHWRAVAFQSTRVLDAKE